MYALSLKRTHPCPYHPLPSCQGMVTFFSLFLRVLPPIFNEHYIYCKVGDDVPVLLYSLQWPRQQCISPPSKCGAPNCLYNFAALAICNYFHNCVFRRILLSRAKKQNIGNCRHVLVPKSETDRNLIQRIRCQRLIVVIVVNLVPRCTLLQK